VDSGGVVADVHLRKLNGFMMFHGYGSVPRWAIIFPAMSCQQPVEALSIPLSAMDPKTRGTQTKHQNNSHCMDVHPPFQTGLINLAIWDRSHSVEHTEKWEKIDPFESI
jgi:hypothetical protein